MKKVTFYIVLVALLFSCAACGNSNQLSTGKIEAKQYNPPYSYYVPGVYIPGHENCSPGYHTENCYYSPGYEIPGYEQYVSAKWKLQILGVGKNKKPRTEWHNVPESTYNSFKVGDIWSKT